MSTVTQNSRVSRQQSRTRIERDHQQQRAASRSTSLFDLIPLIGLLVLAFGLLMAALTGWVALPTELYAAGSIMLSLSVLHQFHKINGFRIRH